MKMEEIDKNLLVETGITEPDIVWLNVRQAPFVICGIIYDETYGCYTRMSQKVAKQVSEKVGCLNFQTAGGRVRFCTDSPFIGIHAVMENNKPMSHVTFLAQSGFDLYRKKADDCSEKFCHSFIPPINMCSGYSSAFYTDGVSAEYTLNFPLFDGVKELYIALKKDASLLEATPYKHSVPIVYYGSSITQAACASRPGNSYQAIISRRLDTDYINLGFAGNCKAEAMMIQYLANLKMSVFVCDYDHNTPDAEYLQKTHLPLYRSIRAKQPNLPIVFLSAPTIIANMEEYAARREIIRESYREALNEGDENVYFIDGAELFAGEDWDSCTIDGVHPNDLGFYRMAMRIEKELGSLL